MKLTREAETLLQQLREADLATRVARHLNRSTLALEPRQPETMSGKPTPEWLRERQRQNDVNPWGSGQ